ncbi:MAG: hypothetical protein K0R39_2256 [Symbiobacteriaceae bacterium]|jgi:membrane protease YdiL (CAAX protease family)|nr:hypothetical protein [Symbiobacteriaceae bacterium]
MSLQATLTRTSTLKHPAVMSFAALWLVSAAILASKGNLGLLIFPPIFLVVCLALAAVTDRLTPPAPALAPAKARGGATAVATVILLAVGAVTIHVAGFHGIIPINWHPSGLTLMWLNPTLMVLLPGAILLALGLRPANLGLGAGRRPWLTGLLWSAPYLLLAIISFVLTGQPGPVRLLTRSLNSFLQNGFSEEFLWRGLLQTALERRLGAQWALVLASLLFGLWHVPSNLAGFGGDYVAAIAQAIWSQALMGLAFGYLYRRTGNLVAPTMFHVASHLVS